MKNYIRNCTTNKMKTWTYPYTLCHTMNRIRLCRYYNNRYKMNPQMCHYMLCHMTNRIHLYKYLSNRSMKSSQMFPRKSQNM